MNATSKTRMMFVIESLEFCKWTYKNLVKRIFVNLKVVCFFSKLLARYNAKLKIIVVNMWGLGTKLITLFSWELRHYNLSCFYIVEIDYAMFAYE